ncbi:hypothetical protein [Serratia fonticola]
MSKETGGPAFPQFGYVSTAGCNSDSSDAGGTGLTLRDHFAGLALQGMITTSGAPALNGFDGFEGHIAKAAYRMADEMLKYRGE